MTTGGAVQAEKPRVWFVWLAVVALVLGVMLYLYYQYPHQNIGPQQPIYFSHRVHAGVKRLTAVSVIRLQTAPPNRGFQR